MHRQAILLICAVFIGSRLSAAACDCKAPQQPCVCAINPDVGGTGTPTVVWLLRAGLFDNESVALIRGTALDVGDRIYSQSRGAAVDVVCNGGSRITVSDRPNTGVLNYVVIPPEDDDCAFEQLGGRINVASSTNTRVKSGQIVMGSSHTQYALELITPPRTPRPKTRVAERSDPIVQVREAIVLEGDATITRPGQERVTIAARQLMSIGASGATRAALSQEHRDLTATLYSTMDLSLAAAAGHPVADRQAAFATLKTAYLRVFEAPGDPAPQVALAAQQLDYRVAAPALYHLGRADAFKAASDSRQGAEIAIVRAAAFRQLGDQAQAVQSYNRAIALDPQVLKRAPKSVQTEVAPMEKMRLDRPMSREVQTR